MIKKNFYHIAAAAVLLTILLWGIGCSSAAAQGIDKKDSPAPKENQLTPWAMPVVDAQNVLPGYVNDVVEDSTGMIWIGTDNGLVRIDPKDNSWRIFSSADGLAGNCINSIHQARDGKIWFCTCANGVSCYDPSHQARHTAKNKFINEIKEDWEGRLLIASLPGIYHSNKELDEWTQVNPPDDLYLYDFDSIEIGEERDIWFSQYLGFVQYKPESNEWM
jgi:ligand-binding sensor domain-containing protein